MLAWLSPQRGMRKDSSGSRSETTGATCLPATGRRLKITVLRALSCLIRAKIACFRLFRSLEQHFSEELHPGPQGVASLVISVGYIVLRGLSVSANCSFLQKTAGFRRFLLLGEGCGARVRPLGTSRGLGSSCHFSIRWRVLYDVPARYVPPCICRCFFERCLLLPLIEPRQPPSKGAQKRLLADGLLPRVVLDGHGR